MGQDMEKLFITLIITIFPSIVIALMYGWMSLLDYSKSWIYVVLGVQCVGLLMTVYAEVNALKVNGASGWVLFSFSVLSFLLAIVLGILKLIALIWSWL